MEIFDVKNSTYDNPFEIHIFSLHPVPGVRTFKEHHHSAFEIGFFLEGEGTYSTATKKYPINSGDTFIFSGNEIHSITYVNPNKPMTLLNLHFDPRILMDDNIRILNSGSNFFFKHSDQFDNRLPSGHPSSQTLLNLVYQMKDELLKQNPLYHCMIKSYLLQLTCELVRNLEYYNTDTVAAHSDRNLLLTMNYIQDHFSEPLTLQSIAYEVGLSPNYLCNIFKSGIGISVWDYVLEQRITTAMSLFSNGCKDTILDIAMQCGFNNTANFNHVFKKYTGTTPKEYRKKGNLALH